jgi:hypothetical protein
VAGFDGRAAEKPFIPTIPTDDDCDDDIDDASDGYTFGCRTVWTVFPY